MQLVPQGGSALVYVVDEANRDSIMKQIKKAFAGVEGVAKVVGAEEFAEYGIADPRRDPHAPDMVLFAKMGYYFGDTAAGEPTKENAKAATGTIRICPICTRCLSPAATGIKPGAQARRHRQQERRADDRQAAGH